MTGVSSGEQRVAIQLSKTDDPTVNAKVKAQGGQ